MASYERYFNHLIKQAQSNTAAYTEQRRRRAETDAQEIRDEYRAADEAAVEQSRQSLAQTDAQYRQAYDANAVSEAVARRNAAEAMANSQLKNSGFHATQQTAVSLARSRADSDVTLRRQAAVDRIVRELDEVRAQYRRQSAEETAAIYKQAQDDVLEYETTQTELAQDGAQALADADREDAKHAADMSILEMKAALEALKLNDAKGNGNGNGEDKPSKEEVEADAAKIKQESNDLKAATFLRKCVSEGSITAEERGEIMRKYGI
ncbi:MAG: hypothetical protein IJC52_01460, partial [Clostridia bacterium]|nr:hypothetical protein [Clostridia bacterium]